MVILAGRDKNGVKDTGEVEQAITTAADGTTFLNVPAGTHWICEVAQGGWTNSDPGSGTVDPDAACESLTVTAGQTASAVFGNYQKVDQSVLKYHDKNADGDKDGAGEPGLENWVFFIDEDGDETKDTDEAEATTNASGVATFSNLMPGASYSICEVLQGTWFNSDPAGTTLCKSTGTLVSGTATTQLVFGNYQKVDQSVLKYHDKNADGDKDGAGEPGLENWVFFIDEDGDETKDTDEAEATTNASGVATFSNLMPGASYSICEVLQGTWFNSDPAGTTLCKSTGTLVSGTATTQLVFGNYQKVDQSVLKYHDKNADGDKDGAGEPGLENWVFFIDEDGDETKDTDEAEATTNASGVATFSNLMPGASYSICEVLQGTWFNSDPAGTTLCKSTGTLVSGTATTQLVFGNYQKVDQSVLKYHDKNADGDRTVLVSRAWRTGCSSSTRTATRPRTRTRLRPRPTPRVSRRSAT